MHKVTIKLSHLIKPWIQTADRAFGEHNRAAGQNLEQARGQILQQTAISAFEQRQNREFAPPDRPEGPRLDGPCPVDRPIHLPPNRLL